MFIKGITYKTVWGGPTTGVFAFQVDLGGGAAKAGEVADAVMKIRTFPQGKQKVIRLMGTFNQENTLDVYTLVKALRDSAYHVQAISDGQTHFPWFSLLTWLIVEVGDELWTGFACNEFRYRFSKDSSGIEPFIPPEVANSQTFLQIVPQEGVAGEQIFKFIREAKHPWSVFSKKTFFMEVQ